MTRLEVSAKFFEISQTPAEFVFMGKNIAKYFYDLYVSKEFKSSIASSYVQHDRSITLKNISNVILCLKKLVHLSILSRKRPLTFFLSGQGRRHTVVNEDRYDLYNFEITKILGRDNVIIYETLPSLQSKLFLPDLTLTEFNSVIAVFKIIVFLLLRKRIFRFADGIMNRVPELGFSIEEIIHLTRDFTVKFFFWKFLLVSIKPKRVILLGHYGNHPAVRACKELEIPIFELQHGLIIPSHTHYCAPAIPDSFLHAFRELLPTKIGVYGEYWKKVLISGKMFSEEMIEILGYYLTMPPKEATKTTNKTVILITSQPTVQNHIIRYVKFLKTKLDSRKYQIWIKPHSNEMIEPFSSLLQDDFVELFTNDTYSLLQKADIHITIHSTVAFEAVRYGVSNYVLFIPEVGPQCQEILDTGVAARLDPDQLPSLGATSHSSVEFYFSAFSPEVLTSA